MGRLRGGRRPGHPREARRRHERAWPRGRTRDGGRRPHRPERGGLQAGLRGQPPLLARAVLPSGHPQRPVSGPGPRGPGPTHGPLDPLRRGLLPRPRPDGVLPLGRVSPRPSPRQQPPQPGRPRRGAPRDGGAGARLRRPARPGGGARSGKRGPRAAGRLLHGFSGHAPGAGDRLRHSLRVRDLRPGHPRRLAGGGDRQVAAPRQSLGDRPSRDRLRGRLRGTHGVVHGRGRPGAGVLVPRPGRPG